MKICNKIVLFLLCSVLLIACTDSENSNEVIEGNGIEEERLLTADPLQVMKDDRYELFQHGSSELEIIGRYISEESDETGIVELEANDYKMRFSLVLIHSPVVNENTIYVLGEHENLNKSGEQMELPPSKVTIDGDVELRDTFSVGPLEADARTSITSMILLEDAIEPETIEIKFQEPRRQESTIEELSNESSEDWKVIKFHRK